MRSSEKKRRTHCPGAPGARPTLERFTETLPVRLDNEPIGEIDLKEVFPVD